MQTGNKFLAFKRYAEQHGLKWGFVRDENEQLYINNTEYVESMADEHWVAIEEELQNFTVIIYCANSMSQW